MKYRYLMALFIVLLISSIFVGCNFFVTNPSSGDTTEFFVGIDVAYDNHDEIKKLIDDVSLYTNFFVIGSTGISYDAAKLDEICQYLYDRDMYFISYSSSRLGLLLASDAQDKYGDHFLGVYFNDEWGGKQLDVYDHRFFDEATDYSDAANQFVDGLSGWLNSRYYPDYPDNSTTGFAASDFRLFTSDYTLYWFDYKAGYDVVFAEFGWNYSRQLNVALCRGAATIQDKDWGVIITWTYNNPPYIESGAALYDDLVLAYESGAKYILIFDSNEEYTHGILQKEHLDALKQFWQYTKDKPRTIVPPQERVSFVLPKDFGYGFRGPDDKIWGLWEANELSFEIGARLGGLLAEYERKLDIIYDDGIGLYNIYSKYIFWNGTTLNP